MSRGGERTVFREYPNFETLSRYENEGRDFRIEWRPRSSPVLVMAPHGGRIEFMTAELAGEIAGSVFSFYAFSGIRAEGNRKLHLTGRVFDEPVGVKAARAAETVLAVHGRRGGASETVMVGGRDEALRRCLSAVLSAEGFPVEASAPGLKGVHPQNICNRGLSGKGLQVELSASLRFGLERDGEKRRRFADAVRSVLSDRFRKE